MDCRRIFYVNLKFYIVNIAIHIGMDVSLNMTLRFLFVKTQTSGNVYCELRFKKYLS